VVVRIFDHPPFFPDIPQSDGLGGKWRSIRLHAVLLPRTAAIATKKALSPSLFLFSTLLYFLTRPGVKCN
jgi:hypothetical protein